MLQAVFQNHTTTQRQYISSLCKMSELEMKEHALIMLKTACNLDKADELIY